MFNNEAIEEGQERWKAIEERADIINDRILEVPGSSARTIEPFSKDLAALLLLLVEHLKPMNPTEEQIKEQLDDVGKELIDLMSQFKTK